MGKEGEYDRHARGLADLFQPFRYRGYVYDWETGLYYLQSRYYDPNTGRFISADILLSTGQGVLGHNCYAYCLGNPVGMVDDGGLSAISATGDVKIKDGSGGCIGGGFVVVGSVATGAIAYGAKDFIDDLIELSELIFTSLIDGIIESINELFNDLVNRFKTVPKQYSHDYEEHHIVLKGDKRMFLAQYRMESVGINTDDFINKVMISTKLHKHLHTNEYKAFITMGIEVAYWSGNTMDEKRGNIRRFLIRVADVLIAASAIIEGK